MNLPSRRGGIPWGPVLKVAVMAVVAAAAGFGLGLLIVG